MEEYIKAANKLADAAEKHGWIERLKNLFSKPQKVLVLGCSGVGKTSIINSLNEDFPKTIDFLTRTQTAQKHKLNLKGDNFEFVDTPGQELHDSRRIKAIREALRSEHLGVINVVSYGYHEHASGADDAFLDEGTVADNYLEKHRALEESYLNEWIQLLGNPVTTAWILTVINKADIWWESRHEVVDHYGADGSNYLQKLRGTSNVDHAVLEYSSVIHRFYGRALVAPTFDQDLQQRLRIRLVESLVQMSK